MAPRKLRRPRESHICILARKKLSYHTRIWRQAKAFSQQGYRVTIISLKENGLPDFERTQWYEQHRIHPAVPCIPASYSPRGLISRRLRKLLRNEKRRNLGLELTYIFNVMTIIWSNSANVYHVHDSYPLIVGYILAKLHRAKLVYDAVELAFDVGRLPAHEKGSKRLWLEKFVIRRADAVFATGDGHATAIADYYGIKKPTILMNCREYEYPSSPPTLRQVARGRKIALYSGSVTRDYGLHDLIESAIYMKDITIFIVGPETAQGYKDELRNLIKQLGVEDRVFLLEPVGRDEVVSLAASADVGVIPLPRNILNYSCALPNKLFDYIMARLPIATYATPDMKRVVNSHDIGVTFNRKNPEVIADAITSVLQRSENYKANLEKAAELYSWEIESKKMIEVYKQLLR